MTELRIELLGGFRVTTGGRVIPDEVWRRRKTAALVKLLALAPRHRLHREQLLDVLWPELAPDAAAANLRKVAHLARRASADGHDEGAIGSEGELLYLRADRLWVDVDAFQADAARARQSRDPDVYHQAIDLHGEGLLPDDRYEEWVVGRRDELQEEYVELLEELAALLEGQGEIARAANATRRLIAIDPLQEEAHIRAQPPRTANRRRRAHTSRAPRPFTSALVTRTGRSGPGPTPPRSRPGNVQGTAPPYLPRSEGRAN